MIDPVSHEPHSGKSFWMTEAIIGNCTMAILLEPETRTINDSTVFFRRLGSFLANL